MPRRLGVAVLAVTLGLGCGESSTDPEPPTLTGSWAGTVQVTGQSYTMELAQDGAAVTGIGTVTDALGTAATAVTGSVTGFNVDLTIRLPNTDFSAIAFTGSFSRPEVVGGTLYFPISRVRDSLVLRRR